VVVKVKESYRNADEKWGAKQSAQRGIPTFGWNVLGVSRQSREKQPTWGQAIASADAEKGSYYFFEEAVWPVQALKNIVNLMPRGVALLM
jgi:hypothetical protein